MRRSIDDFAIEKATGGFILKYYSGEGITQVEIFTSADELLNRIKELLNV